MDKKALLEWYEEAGVDEAIDERPANAFAPPPEKPAVTPVAANAPARPTNKLHHAPSEAAAVARKLADNCHTIEELEAAVRAFDGCAIKKTASRTVFADGNPQARILIIGEAPGVQEDIQGIPFCGPSGKLLDRMLAAIGLDRTKVYISNTVYWRPPGNRQPSPEETTICLPFVEKLVALVSPALLILSGGTAASTILARDLSVSRLRGKFYDYNNGYLTAPVPVMLMYHPSYLLRSPQQKRLAWADLLMAQEFLRKEGHL